ncbi:hypothetical protein [Sphingomonas sp. RIT328]|uniref:hypothetical protein n=1 Tax=Sphingomonas sp. RIT328 TaxID=1470591 RepID=UPI0004520F7C|nr:hypothetical protein [Sphingomonas sp. RIT328]EZP49939.1 hypothetical protein BW41_03264 [Sphingomonas sp. RIT328]
MASNLRLPVGSVFEHGGVRIAFVEEIDGFVLRFLVEGSDEEFHVVLANGVRVRPTVQWVLVESLAGRLVDCATGQETISEWAGRFLGLDKAACLARQPMSVLKYDIALRALIEGMPRNADRLRDFASKLVPDDVGAPSGRSVIRWMNNLELNDGRIGAMCNRSGRPKGWSPLAPVADRLVQQGMALFYADTSLKKMGTVGLVVAAWTDLKERGVRGLGEAPPSKTTIVNRINANENLATTTSKFGRHDAKRTFVASGETITVSRPFEMVFLDGTEFEQVVHYSSDVRIPSAKLKAVGLIDGCSLYAFPNSPFAGPYRAEMSMNALMGALLPPTLDEATLAENPELVLNFGRIGVLKGDNDKALLPPSALGNLANVMRRVELARKFSPNDKSPVEGFWKWMKGQFDNEPGTVLSPRSRKRSIRRDPLAEASMTRASFARKYEQRRLLWNDTAHGALGDRTPNQIMAEFIDAEYVRRMRRADVQRQLARTVDGHLTTDGVTYDNVRYRWNRAGITKLLSENLASQAFASRLQGTAKIAVSLRVYDWNLDFIEVFDQANNAFVTLWSDDPEYTEFLTRYEHKFHQSCRVSGETGAQTAEERALRRGRSLQKEWENLHNRSYGVAKRAAAVLAAVETRTGSIRTDDPDLTDFEALLGYSEPAGHDRLDVPRGPSQRRTPADVDDAGDAASAPASDGFGPVADLGPDPRTRLDELIADQADDPDDGIDWDEDAPSEGDGR